MNTSPTLRTVTTFTFLGAVVALAVVAVLNWGNLFAAPTTLQASDDPLANRLAIVEPPALTVAEAPKRPAARPETVTVLNSWEYTSNFPSRHH